MYLKNLTIRGFKSFADKTDLEFRSGITAVVGPNGSGKSNISDAVRWVLGEQSVKQLRGGKMEDVIFAGTQFRKPLGQASVSLTLDNSCHTLSVPYNEVTVTRRLYRSGESEYLINNNVVRLRDIHELFMDTGIGREGYSMIGQGKIDAILSGKPEERRGLVEEAAGITKFKARKEEGEKKLKSADDNLVRVEDILSTYEERIGPLKEDKEKAEVFLALSGELKDLQIAVILQELEELEERNAGSITRHQELSEAFARTGEAKAAAEQSQEDLSQALDDLAEEKARTREEYYERKGRFDEGTSQIALLAERTRSCQERAAQARAGAAALTTQIEEARDELTQAQPREQELSLGHQSAIADQRAHEAAMGELEARIGRSEQDSTRLKERQENLRKERRLLDERLSQEQVREKVLQSRQDSLKDLCGNYEASLALNTRGRDQLKAELTAVLDQKADRQTGHGTLREEGTRLQRAAAELTNELEIIRRKVRDAEGREAMLRNLEETHEGYARSVRDLFGYLKRSKSPHLDQAVVLGDVIQTRPEYAVAIEAALGGYIGNIITATDDQAKALIEILKKQKLGRATFLPRNVIRASRIAMPKFKNAEVLGFASDLIETDDAYREIADSVLARTLITRNMDDAVLAARETGYKIKIVTLEGDMILGGGAMSGGSQKGQSSGVMSRRAELETLGQTIAQGRQEFGQKKLELEALSGQLDAKKQELARSDDQLRQLELEETRLAERIEGFVREISRIQTLMTEQTAAGGSLESELDLAREKLTATSQEIEANQSAMEHALLEETELRERRRELFRINDRRKEELADHRIRVTRWETDLTSQRQGIGRLKEQLRSYEERLSGLIADRETQEALTLSLEEETTQIRTERDAHQTRMQALDQTMDELDQKEVQIRSQIKEASRLADTVRDEYYRLEKELLKASLNLEKYESDKEELLTRLNEDLDLTLAQARDLAKPLESKAKAKKRISEIKGKITALGNVNLAAIEEYEKISQHYEFLSSQRNDLLRSKAELEKLIQDMTGKMRALFKENFVILSRNFKDTFHQLFNGGTAELILSEGDVLTGSIDINVQPPGKKLQNINLLSGGEKVLSAIALTFAILRMKPSPFCFLDEIEAALDDANVYRYANFIKEFARETQFILITHRKGTMEAADILYGVTMEEKGISKIVSVDLEPAQEEAV